MECGFRFRIHPTPEQQTLIKKTLGSARYVYNYYLGKRREAYKAGDPGFGHNACSRDLTRLKGEHEWLKEPDSIALQASLENLRDAYDNYFKAKKRGDAKWGPPTFKSKKDRHKSYTTKNVNGNIKLLVGHIVLPKIGRLQCRFSRAVRGRVLSVTVSLAPSGKYHVSICCTGVRFDEQHKTGAAIGLDLGIGDFAVDSNGTKHENHRFLRKHEKKLALLQRRQSRKQIDGKNREKARVKTARLHEYIANCRNDHHHKLSIKIVRENDTIAMETLTVKGMVRNRRLSKHISDAGWGEFARQLKYKSGWYGKTVVQTDTFFASTQKCSTPGCGYLNSIGLSVRGWECPECGTRHDRDVNAAKNILNEGMRLLAHDAPIGLGRPEYTLAESGVRPL